MSYREHLKDLSVWLLSGDPDAIIATLTGAGAIWSEATGQWVLPSGDDPRVHIHLHFGASCDTGPRRFGRSLSIWEHMMDVDASQIDFHTRSLSRCLGIPPEEAGHLMLQAAAWIHAYSTDRAAATATLPRLIQTLLAAHEGVAFDGARCWKSEDVRAGMVDGMDDWPFPSIEEEYHGSDAVFLGRPTRVCWENAGGMESQSLHVMEVLRGKLPRTTTVLSGQLAVGKTYLLFVTRVGSSLVVDWQGNSGSLPGASAALAEVRRIALAERGH